MKIWMLSRAEMAKKHERQRTALGRTGVNNHAETSLEPRMAESVEPGLSPRKGKQSSPCAQEVYHAKLK